METIKTIKSALISVFNKEGLESVVRELHKNNVLLYSTGGTLKYIQSLGIEVTAVESLTSYPEILGGRVKTLHPAIFGGILYRRNLQEDVDTVAKFNVPSIDLVIVDLYPFEETLAQQAEEQEIIEKIDIGGISLIRAAAKNYEDVVIVPSIDLYVAFLDLYKENHGLHLADRKWFAGQAFQVSSHYDTMIYKYFNEGPFDAFKQSVSAKSILRYGENPHQKAVFFGDLEAVFEKLNGKELSFNNLLDVDAAVNLMLEFKSERPTFCILKHNNACGLATANTISEAYDIALASDPISAFGGVLISNTSINLDLAGKLNDLFFEVLIAPEFDEDALELLKSKKNRILLIQKLFDFPKVQFRTALNGLLQQERDEKTVEANDLEVKTELAPTEKEIQDLLFANKIVKHTKSNTIVLVKDSCLLASGTGQTSRVDALEQAIHKAKTFGFDLNGAVMASDAFFPFPDCVEIAYNEGIRAVIHPGGSIKDSLSIDFCNSHEMKMVFTGFRHFKH